MTPTYDKPYYAVIFTSTLHKTDEEYIGLDEILIEKARECGGFLGMDSARSELGISISYWETLEDIQRWRAHTDHIVAINKGIEKWYEAYNVRICKVERNYDFKRT
jgi:heme-degrading monooxygenase HmoA